MPNLTRRPAARARAGTQPRPDRRQAILVAAEKLFAQFGYHAVSIRQIATEAGVPLALVAYYFGQKQELFHAIFEQWRHTVEERLALLAQAQAAPRDAGTLTRLVQAFLEPVLRMRASPEGEYYVLLVTRELSYRTADADRVLVDYFDPLARAFIVALHEIAPHATRGQVAWCYQFALGALLHHLSDLRVERLSDGENTVGDPAGSALLARFIEGGLRAALALPKTGTTRQPAVAKAGRTTRPRTVSASPQNQPRRR